MGAEREKHRNQISRIKKGGVPLMPNIYKKKVASFTVGYSFNNLEDKKEGIDLPCLKMNQLVIKASVVFAYKWIRRREMCTDQVTTLHLPVFRLNPFATTTRNLLSNTRYLIKCNALNYKMGIKIYLFMDIKS